MARTAIATLQTIWDCKWSRPGFQVPGVAAPREPASLWCCVRDGRRKDVSEEQCEKCPHWERDESPEHSSD
jgi:hypothetical protein